MAKFYGKLGFCFDDEQIRPGVWGKVIEERDVYGEIYRNVKNTENSGTYNDNVNINNQISFIADPYAIDNIQRLKYVTYMNSKWAIRTVEVQYPRLIINLGGIYNDQEQTCTAD